MIGASIRLGFFLPHLKAGGVERVVLNLLQRLDRRRFEPTLILASCTGALLPEIPSDVAVIDLAGVKMRSAVPALYRCLKRLNLDLVYSGTNAANVALLAAASLMGSHRPKVVISEHTLPDLYLKEAKWRGFRQWAMRLLYARADLVVTPLADLGLELRAVLGLPSLPVAEILNPLFDRQLLERGADPTTLGPLLTDVRFFVAAGRLSKVKAYDDLLRAFAPIAHAQQDVRLVLLGEGEERESLDTLSDTLHIREQVHFEGFVPNPKDYFSAAVALVLSSKREGTPNVIPEAMAVGLPVIAVDCSVGIRRLLQNGQAGLVVPPDDKAALTRAMSQLLQDPSRRRQLADRGLEQARKFTFNSTVSRYEDIFGDIVGARGDYRGMIASAL